MFSWQRNGFTWEMTARLVHDEPVNEEVLLAECVNGEYEEVEIKATNYFKGHWIDHPAQTSLWQIPEPCERNAWRVLSKRPERNTRSQRITRNGSINRWGRCSPTRFRRRTRRKCWTCEPQDLDIDWIGQRVLRPKYDDVVNSAKGPLPAGMCYVSDRYLRYPSKGGFLSYCHKLADGADIRYGMKLVQVDLGNQVLRFANGAEVNYRRLVSTIPLYLIKISTNA